MSPWFRATGWVSRASQLLVTGAAYKLEERNVPPESLRGFDFRV